MTDTAHGHIYVAVRSKLNNDIVRLTDGSFDAAVLVETLLEDWIHYSLEMNAEEWFGDRAMEAAEIYNPGLAAQWQAQDEKARSAYQKQNRPLVWKELSLRPGTNVRMTYDGVQHYATVKEGEIEDDNGRFSPSQWASKVAGGTSRNAWRDIWFKEPLAKTWVPAELMRNQAKEEMLRQTSAERDPE